MPLGLIRYSVLHKTYRDCIMLREKNSAVQNCHFRVSESPAYMYPFILRGEEAFVHSGFCLRILVGYTQCKLL